MEDELLKLRPLQGRWMFHKASGKKLVFLWSFKLVVSSKYLQLEQWHITSLKQYVIYFPYKLGVSGQRKLSVIPTDTECYSGLQLRSVSNNGKNIILLVPLQEATDTKLLPYDAAEFSKMAQRQVSNSHATAIIDTTLWRVPTNHTCELCIQWFLFISPFFILLII